MAPLLVVVNSTGAQGISVIKSASEAGFHIRAQVRSATEGKAKLLAEIPNVTLVEGTLDDTAFVNTLFQDADYAWVNTTYYQKDEMKEGKDLALAAKNAGVKHYIFSSLSDHSKITNGRWKNPIWIAKYAVEEYIRSFENFPATFVYVGGYMQNYNSNIFIKTKRLEDGSIVWTGRVDPNAKQFLLDIENDLGPSIVNILKEGPGKWNHKRVPLAFEKYSMKELEKIFTEVTGVKVTYEQIDKELDPKEIIDNAIGILNEEVYFDWDCKVPDEARELNPNWHSVENFAKNMWKPPA